MLTIALEPSAGPPPPPPPIYIGSRTRGSKDLGESKLFLTLDCEEGLASKLAVSGGILWLLGPSGTGPQAIVPKEAFAGSGTVHVELCVTGVEADPDEIRLQPRGDAEAALVETDPCMTDLVA